MNVCEVIFRTPLKQKKKFKVYSQAFDTLNMRSLQGKDVYYR